MARMKFETPLLEKRHRAADIWSFRFEKPGAYEFRAGQWGAIDIVRDEGVLSHHFTHSSSPTEPFLELTTRVRESEFKRVLAGLEPGDEVSMDGPFGSFVLPEGEENQVVFLTGGIGITPVRSILRYLADGGATINATLFFANRDEENIAFREELASLESSLPGLAVIHLLSDPGAGWAGPRGRLDARLLESVLETLAGHTYYISGPPGMVQSMKAILREQAVAEDSIHTEDFAGYE